MMRAFAVGSLSIPTNASQTGLIPTWQSKAGNVQAAGSPVHLGGVENLGDDAAIEIEVDTNGTAPGAGASLTAYVAQGYNPNYSVAQLKAGAIKTVFDISGLLANTKNVLLIPNFEQSSKYMFLFFDNAAMAAGATLNLRTQVNVG
jgi:hypothetical protein